MASWTARHSTAGLVVGRLHGRHGAHRHCLGLVGGQGRNPELLEPPTGLSLWARWTVSASNQLASDPDPNTWELVTPLDLPFVP